MENWLNLIPVAMMLIAFQVLFLTESWRRMLIALAVVHLGIFILLFQHLPLAMAAAKVITGWVCVVILSFVTVYELPTEDKGAVSRSVFKSLALIMVWVVAYFLTSKIVQLFQISPEVAFSAFALFCGGLLQLGMTSSPFKVIIGILSSLAGFGLLYAGIESSVLVNGLLLLVDLLIAVVGSYLVANGRTGEAE